MAVSMAACPRFTIFPGPLAPCLVRLIVPFSALSAVADGLSNPHLLPNYH